jgi:hypothetical protein
MLMLTHNEQEFAVGSWTVTSLEGYRDGFHLRSYAARDGDNWFGMLYDCDKYSDGESTADFVRRLVEA